MPEQTPYENTELEMLFIFPNDYPQHPPIVLPQTNIYHINLQQDVNASLPILQDDWSSFLNLSKVLFAVQAALIEPDTQTPLSSELLERYEEDPEGFEEEARMTANQPTPKMKPTEDIEPNLNEGSISGIRSAELPEILRNLDQSPEKPAAGLVKRPSREADDPILEVQHE
jgi:ubiquitin-protein ligase